MTLQEFSSLSGKELNTEYNVDGHVVILTNKEREHKAGAQTFFSGSVDGQTFEHRNVKGVCTFINGGKNESAPRTPRKTAIEPKHGTRIYNGNETFTKAANVLQDYKKAVWAMLEAEERVSDMENEYCILANGDDPFNVCSIVVVLEKRQREALERAKRNARLKAIYEGRLHVRAELYKSAKEEISEVICADRTPTKAQKDRLKKAKTEFEEFSNRVHVWDMDL